MSDYLPIDCEFHDLLESHATTRKSTDLEYRDAAGTLQHVTGIVHDVYARDRAEYLTLSSGQTLRLDAIVSVNGVRPIDL